MTSADRAAPRTARVNGWSVADARRSEVVERLADMGVRGGPALSVGLHVSALATSEAANERLSRSVDLAYADGVSVVALARLAGARRVQKTTTTYIAGEILEAMRPRLGRDPRVALVGGPPGLAERAVPGLRREARVEVVYTCDGFASEGEWTARLRQLGATPPDVTFVGLGHPWEVEWCIEHRDALPGLVLTCGGFFGYLAGHEHRAPGPVRDLGFEWAWRTAQAPRRLLPRYARGAWNVLRVGARVVRERAHRTGAP